MQTTFKNRISFLEKHSCGKQNIDGLFARKILNSLMSLFKRTHSTTTTTAIDEGDGAMVLPCMNLFGWLLTLIYMATSTYTRTRVYICCCRHDAVYFEHSDQRVCRSNDFESHSRFFSSPFFYFLTRRVQKSSFPKIIY